MVCLSAGVVDCNVQLGEVDGVARLYNGCLRLSFAVINVAVRYVCAQRSLLVTSASDV